jgi:hypothetical protein
MGTDTSLLQAALIGYEAQVERINTAIQDLQKQLGRRTSRKATPTTAPASGVTRRKRHLSAEARARIAEAQRKRWAAYRRRNARTMSAGRSH